MKVVYYTIIIIVLTVLQTTVFNHLQIWGVKPQLTLILVTVAGLAEGGIVGGFVGLATGIALDVTSGGIPGLNALLLMMIGIFTSFAGERFFHQKMLVVAFFVFCSNFVYQLVYYFVSFFIWGHKDVLHVFVRVILPECGYSTLIAVLLYPILMVVLAKVERMRDRIG